MTDDDLHCTQCYESVSVQSRDRGPRSTRMLLSCGHQFSVPAGTDDSEVRSFRLPLGLLANAVEDPPRWSAELGFDPWGSEFPPH